MSIFNSEQANDLARRIEEWADQKGQNLARWGYTLPWYAKEGSDVLAEAINLLSGKFTGFEVKSAPADSSTSVLHFKRK